MSDVTGLAAAVSNARALGMVTSNNPERWLDPLMIQTYGRQASRISLLGDLRRGRRMVSSGTSVVFPILAL